MKRENGIKNRFQKATANSNPEMDKVVFEDVLRTYKKALGEKSAAPQSNIWRGIMQSRIMKFAAAAVIIIAVLVVVKMISGSDKENGRTIVRKQDVTQKEIAVETPKEIKTDTEEKLEVELKDIKQMFVSNDVSGLVDMLDKGRLESKVAAANYLAKIGDLSVIGSLESSAEKWTGNAAGNPFSAAISKIQERVEQQKREDAVKQGKVERETKNSTKAGGGGDVGAIIVLKTIVKVVDEQGNAVADAKVKPDGLRAKASRSDHYGWVSERHGEPKTTVTDRNGVAEILYPKYVIEKLETGAVSFSVEHPEYCATREYDYPVEGEAKPVVLRKGAIVRVSGYIGSKENIASKIYPQVSSNNVWIAPDSWKEAGNGIFESRQIEAGPHYLRLVHFIEGGQTHFSKTVLFKAEKNELHEFNLELKPGVRVEGRIDDSVARPVTGGRVVARISPVEKEQEAGIFAWITWSEIDSEGRFVFESLPWDKLQLTGFCDGFVSASPDSDEGSKSFVRPQLFYLDEEKIEVNLAMERSATCEVRVVNDANEPIEGAKVTFWPNVRWEDGGSQFFVSFLAKSEDIIRNEKGLHELIARSRRNDFEAITNKAGVAIVRNLPGLGQSFSVSHDEYEMPLVKSVGQVRRRDERVNLVSGETAKVTVKMQKKGTDVLGEGEGENIAQKREPARPQMCGIDGSDDYVGVKVTTKVKPEEFSGYVVDENDIPLKGVLVDAWTWYNGNETYTDANGFFQLNGFKETWTIEVRFSKDNYSPRLIVRQPLGVRGAVVKLNNKTFFEGKVTTSEGAPVTRALIRASQGPKQAEGVYIGTIWTEVESDEDGNYRLYVDDDTYDIQVKAKDGVSRYENVSIKKDEAKHFDIVLDSGLTFRAKVLDKDTNEPVEGFQLFNWEHKDVEGISGSDGMIEISGMLPGKFDFSVEAKQCGRWWSEQSVSQWNHYCIDDKETSWQKNFDGLDFDIVFNMEPVTIFTEKPVRITGKVLGPDGKAVSGATVSLSKTGSGNSITGDTRYSFTTGESGSFEMIVPASNKARYNLIAHDGKYNEWRKWSNGVTEPFRTEPGEELTGVELWLTEPGMVRGSVVNKSGEPIIGRKVRAHAFDKLGNRYYDPTTETDTDGNFELKFIRPGKHYIQAYPFWLTAEQAPEGASQVIEVKAGEIVENIELVGEQVNN